MALRLSPKKTRPAPAYLSLADCNPWKVPPLLDKPVTVSLTPNLLQADILRHLTFTLGKDAPHASVYDWRMALSFAIRDRIVDPWFASTRRTWAEDRKRVYYLSMEFLIGRILEDATVNLGLREIGGRGDGRLGAGFRALVIGDEPDAALGQWRSGAAGGLFHGKHGDAGLPGLRLWHPL